MAACAIRKFSSLVEEWESRKRRKEDEVKEEEEKKDTCVYDEYKEVKDVTDDMFSEDDPEDYRTYCKYAIKTEGFYVPFAPKKALCVATPIDPSNSFWPMVEDAAEMAVEHYNKNRAGLDGQLKLVYLHYVNLRSVGGMIFYITLGAERVSTGEINDYQAKVFMRIDMSLEVQMFRKDPKIVAELIERHKAGLL